MTLRDAVWFRPSSRPGDSLARDKPGFALVELNPREIMAVLLQISPFWGLFEVQGCGSSSAKAAPPKRSCICSDKGLVSVRTRSGLPSPGAVCRCHFLEPVACDVSLHVPAA